MLDQFGFRDDLGPTKIIHVWEPGLGLDGVLVVDNVAAGPSIGGLRMAEDVTTEECFRLARAMTLKNAAAGLAHGGGKSVLKGDPGMPAPDKERLIRAFASALGDISDYIFGPDMGTNELAMAWVKDEIGRSVGLPPEVGGIPLDELGATGWGLLHAIDVAAEDMGLPLDGARVAIQGYGAVGYHAARFLKEKGAVLVAASDSRGAVANPDGMDPEALHSAKQAGRSIAEFASGERIEADALIDVDCEIWVPAARPDVLTEANVDRLKTRIVAQGANIPATPEAERRLHERDVLVLPDFIANAGGVICAAMEYHGAGESAAFAAIEDKVRRNMAAVLSRMRNDDLAPRQAAERLARERVEAAMATRRWSIF
ncbi:MAG: Glu/Leu/Phe/Val dehydrogenase [Alphaproteobacteria bacterium]|jgi:glutamate dehydrogenase (NAD(P)+)|nr:Glu/Leu/Phe/Val dehydrogenase [Alphaproteobacteria bacterium]